MRTIDVINAVATDTGLDQKTVEKVYQSFKKTILETAKSNTKVVLTGFVSFLPAFRKGRSGNINGVDWQTEDKSVVKAKISKSVNR